MEVEGPLPVVLFWDLDNKYPPAGVSLASCLTALRAGLGPDYRLEAAHVYANLEGLRRELYGGPRSLLPDVWSTQVQVWLEAVAGSRSSHGARLELQPPAVEPSGPVALPPAGLTVTANRPQAVDCRLVRDLMHLTAPVSALARRPGAVCLLSDDSDFAVPLSHVRLIGWRAAVVCSRDAWTLRERSDAWLSWSRLCRCAAENSLKRCYRLAGRVRLGPSGASDAAFAVASTGMKQHRRRVLKGAGKQRVHERAARLRAAGRRPGALPPGDSVQCPVPFAEPDGEGGASLGLLLEAAGAPSAAADTLRPFLLASSLGCPFLVLSEGQLVKDVRAPGRAELEALLEVVAGYMQRCEARGAALVVDFEGDMLGHGGVLATAAMQETSAVEAGSLSLGSPPAEAPHMPGLLLDLGSSSCVAVLRRVLESPDVTKLIWGADADCKNLMYQELPVRLCMQPAAIVDVQLAFSTRHQRLGMGRMLGQVPPELMARLPKKTQQIDFDAYNARNRSAWATPLSRRHATYAVDDVHRVEAILRGRTPKGGSYAQAKAATDTALDEIRTDPHGFRDLQDFGKRLEKLRGRRRVSKAVQGMRHVHSLRVRGLPLGAKQKLVDIVEAKAAAVLAQASVEVPTDLSFAE